MRQHSRVLSSVNLHFPQLENQKLLPLIFRPVNIAATVKARWLLLPLLVILLAGCASKHPTIGAWRSTGFSPARTDKIALTLRPNPGAEDEELGRLLTAEFQRQGFNLVPQAEADYTLA